MAVAMHGARQGGGIAPQIGGAFDLAPRLRDGLAGFQHLDQRDPFAVLVDQVGHAVQQRGAFLARQHRPVALIEGRAGSCDGSQNLGLAPFGGAADDHPVRGRDAVKCGPIGAVHPSAPDQVAAGEGVGKLRARGGDYGHIGHVISPERRVCVCL